MNLADKPCYPKIAYSYDDQEGEHPYIYEDEGLAFRERLIIALASNPFIFQYTPNIEPDCTINSDRNAKILINQADAIIKELMKGYE